MVKIFLNQKTKKKLNLEIFCKNNIFKCYRIVWCFEPDYFVARGNLRNGKRSMGNTFRKKM